MSDNGMQRVRQTWDRIYPQHADTAGAAFYARLFEIAPEVKPLFKGDMQQQGRKLMTAINLVVSNTAGEDLSDALLDLGKRHVDYGVKEEHFDAVGQALLETLANALGDEFDETTRTAWSDAYQSVAYAMKKAWS